jgi:hypothetical protein
MPQLRLVNVGVDMKWNRPQHGTKLECYTRSFLTSVQYSGLLLDYRHTQNLQETHTSNELYVKGETNEFITLCF